MVNPEIAHDEIRKILDSQIEWLLIQSNGKSFALQTSEIELEYEREKLLFSFPDDKGFQTWRVAAWKYEKRKIILELSGSFGKDKAKTELVPRGSSSEFAETIELAGIEKANKIADLIIENHPKGKLVRVELNKENGRFARIIFEDFREKQTAVLAAVSETLTPEILLTSVILWLEKLQNRKKNSIETVWILAAKKTAADLQKTQALLRENWKRKIKIWEIGGFESGEKVVELKELEVLNLKGLFRKKPKKVKIPANRELSETARRIIEIAPGKINALHTKNGETLCFCGLAFARIRKTLTEEKVWFGVETSRLSLGENNLAEFAKLIDELKIYRRHDSPNKQHLFYKHASEAWLESILRKNIKLLDANLILSPIHNQFRAERDKIDLLALRRDGRLVIVEVKTAPDREMIFQAADYWRKVEAERRAGNLQKAKIFGDLEIRDEPALVYLVAPLLSYHRDFDFLAQTISSELEIYRFDANENWRKSVKISRRERISLEQAQKLTKI